MLNRILWTPKLMFQMLEKMILWVKREIDENRFEKKLYKKHLSLRYTTHAFASTNSSIGWLKALKTMKICKISKFKSYEYFSETTRQ